MAPFRKCRDQFGRRWDMWGVAGDETRQGAVCITYHAGKESGINTEEISWKQQPEKTYSVSVVIFELELC